MGGGEEEEFFNHCKELETPVGPSPLVAYSTTRRNGNRANGNHLEICLSFSQKNGNSYLGPGGLDSVFYLPCTV